MGMNLNMGNMGVIGMNSNGFPGSLGSAGVAAGLGNLGMGQVGQGPGSSAGGSVSSAQDDEKIYALVIDLLDPETRDTALLELSKKREQYDDLALVLWHSFGMCPPSFPTFLYNTMLILSFIFLMLRRYASFAPGNRLCLSHAFPAQFDGNCLQQSV